MSGAAELTTAETARGELLLARLVDFSRLLWELGLDVGTGKVVELADGLSLIDVADREAFYLALKVTLVSKHDQEGTFDAAFDYYWRARDGSVATALPVELEGARRRSLPLPGHRREQAPQEDARSAGTPIRDQPRHPASRFAQARRRERDVQPVDEAGLVRAYSREEALRRKDFEEFTWEELYEARALMERAHWRLGERETRRLRSAHRGRELDLRRTIRRSLHTGGEPVELARRARRWKPRPLVILCDISGSMSVYARLLLHFVHTVANGLENVETFVFGTRLTRITRQLTHKDVDQALRDVTRTVADWSGGTRIGDSLRSFNYRWARRVLGRGAVVLIISDGWDRGDVRALAGEMDRLRRNCHRLIWLNPLLGHDDYRPVTAGMRAALPYIDDFLPANNLDSLFALGRALEAIDDRRSGRARAIPLPG